MEANCEETSKCDLLAFYKERVEYLENLVRKYKFDVLTGLMGKSDFLENKDRLFEEFRFADQGFVFALIDIDNLHNINREHGYHYGDTVIQSIADQLKETFQFHQVYRISGDEFALLIRDHCATAENIDEVLDRIEGVTYIIESPKGYTNPKQMFKVADAKLSDKKSTIKRI